jgi:hypothetical protein
VPVFCLITLLSGGRRDDCVCVYLDVDTDFLPKFNQWECGGGGRAVSLRALVYCLFAL